MLSVDLRQEKIPAFPHAERLQRRFWSHPRAEVKSGPKSKPDPELEQESKINQERGRYTLNPIEPLLPLRRGVSEMNRD